jgi:DNA-binding NtrC family response regulator
MRANHEHVWVIDDDRSIRWVLERALARADIEVTSFETAGAALKALERDTPDTVVTDIRMPGMDGLELLDRSQAGIHRPAGDHHDGALRPGERGLGLPGRRLRVSAQAL